VPKTYDPPPIIPTRQLDIPYKPAMPMDTRYRDVKLQAADLGQGSFDEKTGMLNGDDPSVGMSGADNSPDEDPMSDSVAGGIFGEKMVGNITGAKPVRGPWMQMKDTPKVSPMSYRTDPNMAFAYFINLDDDVFTNVNRTDSAGNTNFYRNGTFFIGKPQQGCPDIIDWITKPEWKRHTLYDRADFGNVRSDNCYNYYILNHSKMPWLTMERPGPSTEDPLSEKLPSRSFLNNCQPIINGWDATYIQFAKDDQKPKEKLSGYSPVWQYKTRADGDEAEYLLSTYLQRSWDANFVYLANSMGKFKLKAPAPFNEYFGPIGLPCVRTENDPPPPYVIFPTTPPKPKPVKNRCMPDSVYDTSYGYYDTCSPPFFPMPPDFNYNSPGKVDPYYCPNVEKITEPSHPFSPRNDYSGTDREYSDRTSIKLRDPKKCPPGEPKCWGYTDWNQPDARKPKDKILNPVVQCGVVPVDIMNFRRAAFDSCIMQRINWNFNVFIQDWIDNYETLAGACPEPQHSDRGGRIAESGWRNSKGSPCKTRYWEQDTIADCPVKMSIQQCCRIIVKDVVPANFVKLRTCEGLRPARAEDKKLQDALHASSWQCDYDSVSSPMYSNADPDVKIYTITDDTFGIFGAPVNINSTCANIVLNEKICKNTEPGAYLFTSYFSAFNEPYKGKLLGYHMPYLRWWDTGVSALNPRHGGSFVNTLGGFDALVGVGREERSIDDGKDSKRLAEEIGGTAPPEVMKPQMEQQGRIGGWTELRAHEMWTIRRSNLFCVGRYDKLMKPGAQESIALAKAGSGYSTKAGTQFPWSWSWLGYAGDTHGQGFPSAFGNGTWTAQGLDNALPGDIIAYTINGMTVLAYVTDIGGYALPDSELPLPDQITATFDFNNARYRLGKDTTGKILHPTRIHVITWDNGKYQSATGASINWGMGPERTIYKNLVPRSYRQEICNKTFRALTYYMKDINTPPTDYSCLKAADDELDAGKCMRPDLKCQPSCADPDYNSCVLPNSIYDWEMASVFRPNQNNRPACVGVIAGTPPGYNFDLAKTYSWKPPTTDVTTQPDKSVIYQSQSGLVNSNLWSFCVNQGNPPPHHWSRDYNGPQTGAITKTTLCGPKWRINGEKDSGCSAATNVFKFFPQGGGR